MGVNHVNLSNGEEVIDLREDTVTEDVLLEGYTAHNSQGDPIVGKAKLENEGGLSVQVDWLQNDNTKPDFIKNKPFYEEGTSITWDGDATGKETVLMMEDSGVYFIFVKISDIPLSDMNVLIGGQYGVTQEDSSISYGTIGSENFIPFSDNIIGVDMDGIPGMLNVLATDTTDAFGIPLTFETGIYFVGVFAGDTETQAMAYASVCGNSTIKPIDEKFIPDTIARKSVLTELDEELRHVINREVFNLNLKIDQAVSSIDNAFASAVGSGVLE